MSGRRAREQRRLERAQWQNPEGEIPQRGPSKSPGFGGLHLVPVWNRGWQLGLTKYTRTSTTVKEPRKLRRLRRLLLLKKRDEARIKVKPFTSVAPPPKPTDEKRPGFFKRVIGKLWGTQRRGQ